jgi:hypothetical protein
MTLDQNNYLNMTTAVVSLLLEKVFRIITFIN